MRSTQQRASRYDACPSSEFCWRKRHDSQRVLRTHGSIAALRARVKRFQETAMSLRIFSISCALALMSACASSGFVSSWKAPDATPLQVKGSKVGAVVMLQDETSRRVAEDALAREINARGAQGIPGYTVMPDSRPATEAEARAAFENAGVQGIVVMRPVSVDKEVVSTPVAPVTYLGPAYRSYWGGYYAYGSDRLWA